MLRLSAVEPFLVVMHSNTQIPRQRGRTRMRMMRTTTVHHWQQDGIRMKLEE